MGNLAIHATRRKGTSSGWAGFAGSVRRPPDSAGRAQDPSSPAAFAARFISCLCARTRASDSGPVMSATER
ncbi:hypothetical protein Srut_10400 [Streptomyces rutgersensis]|nr:hypothetical protein Srut_10400 [Streptomyces rutgersensis]